MDDIKRTTVKRLSKAELAQYDRPGFVPVCRYGRDMPVDENEIGGIFVRAGKVTYNRHEPSGVWEIGEYQCVERIFAVMPAIGDKVKIRRFKDIVK